MRYSWRQLNVFTWVYQMGHEEEPHMNENNQPTSTEETAPKALAPENVVYLIAGFAFLMLMMMGPQPDNFASIAESQAMPWMLAYGVDGLALLWCGMKFLHSKRWILAVASLVFVGSALVCCIALATMPTVAVGAW